jgi:hypothetical protein
MRLRQIALVARDLARAREDIAAVLGIDYAYVDPAVTKYGLRNVVFPVGDTFLEVVSPQMPGTTAGRLLDKRGGDGGYMVILQVPDVALARERVRDLGVRIVAQVDREGVAMTHLHPKDTGGAILSLDSMNPATRWDWGGPNWQHHVDTGTSVLICGVELQSHDPAGMARRWTEVLGVVADRIDQTDRIALHGGEIRFVGTADDRGEGLSAFDVVVRDPKAVRLVAAERGLVGPDGALLLAGTRLNLVAAREIGQLV